MCVSGLGGGALSSLWGSSPLQTLKWWYHQFSEAVYTWYFTFPVSEVRFGGLTLGSWVDREHNGQQQRCLDKDKPCPTEKTAVFLNWWEMWGQWRKVEHCMHSYFICLNIIIKRECFIFTFWTFLEEHSWLLTLWLVRRGVIIKIHIWSSFKSANTMKRNSVAGWPGVSRRHKDFNKSLFAVFGCLPTPEGHR